MVGCAPLAYRGLMLEYKTAIEIDAPAAVVWEILLDTATWQEWDPYCDRIETSGPLSVGAKVKAFTKLSPGRAFGVKVTTLDPEQRMVWTGGMPLGLFKGERTYALRGQGETTIFNMREVFSGPMLGLIAKSIPDMSEAFHEFAVGLKERAEARTAA